MTNIVESDSATYLQIVRRTKCTHIYLCYKDMLRSKCEVITVSKYRGR